MDYTFQMENSVPIAKGSTHTAHWTWKSWDGAYMEP